MRTLKERGKDIDPSSTGSGAADVTSSCDAELRRGGKVFDDCGFSAKGRLLSDDNFENPFFNALPPESGVRKLPDADVGGDE